MMGRKIFLLFFVFAMGCAPALQSRPVTPASVASRTLGGAAIGAAAGAVGGAVVGQPATGAAAGGAAGGLLGLLSSIFSLTVVDVGGAPYGGGYQAPYYGGRTYTPEGFCGFLEDLRERELCEVEFKASAEEKRQQVASEIEQDACHVAAEQVRASGTVPESYCMELYSDAWRQDACKKGINRCVTIGYRRRENDIKRSARDAGDSSVW